MSEPPKRSLRRRIAGLILLLGALFLGNRFLGSSAEVVSVEIHYRLGSEAAARRLDTIVRPVEGGETAAEFHSELVAEEVVQRPRLRPGMYEVEVTVTRVDGTQATVRRRFEARSGATVTIDLARISVP